MCNMRKILLLIALILVIGAITLYMFIGKQPEPTKKSSQLPSAQKSPSPAGASTEVIAEGLDTPWAIAFLPDSSMLITERPGRVRIIDPRGNLVTNSIQIPDVKEIGEGGLLGITIDPEYTSNHFVYLYYTYSGASGNTLNRVARMTYKDASLSDEKVLVDAIPGSSNHNGGRIKFGPDGYLYITTGDAENPSQAQDKNSLAGKILRVTKDGKAAPENPFNNRTYSYGHRNPQGITWDEKGNLWETEHGRSIPISGLDEINLIKPGTNYGWPTIQGNETRAGMTTPIINSGGSTWAPAGVAYTNGTLLYGGLKGQGLFEAKISGNKISGVLEHFKNEYGRIRETLLGPNGILYITTSNNDGRGTPKNGDDKVIRINLSDLN